jgi:hypothetical protein
MNRDILPSDREILPLSETAARRPFCPGTVPGVGGGYKPERAKRCGAPYGPAQLRSGTDGAVGSGCGWPLSVLSERPGSAGGYPSRAQTVTGNLGLWSVIYSYR